jgi:hypothetical protein
MNNRITTALVLSIVFLLVGGFANYLFNLEATSKVAKTSHIVVTCKDPLLSYSEPATGSDELKCDWKTITWIKK